MKYNISITKGQEIQLDNGKQYSINTILWEKYKYKEYKSKLYFWPHTHTHSKVKNLYFTINIFMNIVIFLYLNSY